MLHVPLIEDDRNVFIRDSSFEQPVAEILDGFDFRSLTPLLSDTVELSHFLHPNKPCQIRCPSIGDSPKIKLWISEDHVSINHEELFLNHGDESTEISASDCHNSKYGSHTCNSMTLTQYHQYWLQHKSGHDPRLLYCKDWHWARHYRDRHGSLPYLVPPPVRDDWLNEFYDQRQDVQDDYRFVYVGPAGTWTPLHADVLRSYSWSVNIVGHKRWVLFPPGEEKQLLANPRHKKGAVLHVSDMDLSNVAHCVILQQPGDMLFVPSGWFHFVENLTDCVSVNHNWLNGFNVSQTWHFLQTRLADIEEETADVRDTPGWREECQLVLRALESMNFSDFVIFLLVILKPRWMRLSACDHNSSVPDKREDVTHVTLESMFSAAVNHLCMTQRDCDEEKEHCTVQINLPPEEEWRENPFKTEDFLTLWHCRKLVSVLGDVLASCDAQSQLAPIANLPDFQRFLWCFALNDTTLRCACERTQERRACFRCFLGKVPYIDGEIKY